MGCCGQSKHVLVSPDPSQPNNVIHSTSNKISSVTPLPQALQQPVIPADTDETGLVYHAKQSNDSNLVALCKKGKLESIQSLIFEDTTKKVDINVKGMWGNTPLMAACQYHHPEVALYLMELSSIDVNHLNENGCSALLFACVEGLDAVVTRLLSLGANPNLKPAIVYNSVTDRSDYMTPLIASIINGHINIFERLLSSGCELQLPITQKSDQVALVDGKKIKLETSGITPLMIACKYQQMEIMQALLHDDRIRDSYFQQDSEGSTALHYLCRIKKASSTPSDPASPAPPSLAREMLTTFLSSVADTQDLLKILYLPDKNGSYPIHVACESTDIELVECLLVTEQSYLNLLTVDRSLQQQKTITQVRAMNAMGYTPLHIAIKKRSTEIVKLLLEYNSNPYQPLVANPAIQAQRVTQATTEKCAYDAAMKLRQNTEIYQLLSSYHETKQQQQQQLDDSANLGSSSSSPPPSTLITALTETTVPQLVLLSQDTKEADEIVSSLMPQAEDEDDDLTGQEMRIHEIVSSLSTSTATPKIPTKPSKVEKKVNFTDSEEGKGPVLMMVATSSEHVLDVSAPSTSTSMSSSNYQTPMKSKPNFHQIVPQSPLKGTEERNKEVREREMEGGDHVMRIASPLFLSDEKLTLLSP